MSLLYRITCDGYTLLDQTVAGYDMTEAVLTREINDGMFDATLEMTIFGTNPNLDKLHLLSSTVIVTEIDGETETQLFHGRPISVTPMLNYQTKVTCEDGLKFLLDIPDVFSKMVNRTTVYRIGSEDKYQDETMRVVPSGRFSVGPNLPYYAADIGDFTPRANELTRFNENLIYNNCPVYRSEVLDGGVHKTASGGTGIHFKPNGYGGSRYSVFRFPENDTNKTFTVEIKMGNGSYKTYEIPLQACTYQLTNIYEGLYKSPYLGDSWRNPEDYKGVAKYLGNINIIAENNEYFNIAGFNPSLSVPVRGDPYHSEETLGELEFCIVYYSHAPHWGASIIYDSYSPSTDYRVEWDTGYETVIYTATSPAVSTVWLKAYRSGATTIRAMANSILGRGGALDEAATPQAMTDATKRYRYTGDDQEYKNGSQYYQSGGIWTEVPDGTSYDGVIQLSAQTPQNMIRGDATYQYTGEHERYQHNLIYVFDGQRWRKEQVTYNTFVDPSRQIFLGNTELDADVEYTSIDTCYSNMRKWLEETGGYAKIVKHGKFYQLDLLQDSGVQCDDFYVDYGKNLLDASETILCDNIVTGVYVKGIWKATKDSTETDGETTTTTETTDNPDYELLLRCLDVTLVKKPQDMTVPDLRYRYIGATHEYINGRYYKYNTILNDNNYTRQAPWIEMSNVSNSQFDEVSSPLSMTDTSKIYKYTGDYVTYETDSVYINENSKWKVDPQANTPFVPAGFEADYASGVIWNTEAKEHYGRIVHYMEVNVSTIAVGNRLQYMVDKGIEELQNKLFAFVSYDISVVDPRIIGMDGKAPILGNYYPIDIPWLGLTHKYERLSKIVTNMLDHSNTKLTLGNKTPLLSDYVAKKGERL